MTIRLGALAVCALLVAACGSTPAATVPPSPTPTPAVTTMPSVAPSPTPTASPTPTPAPSPTLPAPGNPEGVVLGLERVVEGLDSPLLVTHAGDGSGRLFVVEQAGRIRVVADGRLLEQPYLDISRRITAGGERGLLGLAFHPRFGAGDRRLFVNYTDGSGNTVVSSFLSTGPSAEAVDPGSEVVLLRIKQPYANHNGGVLAFGPDGFLYVGTGDGGSGGDPLDSGQRLDSLLGKILRIDVDGTDGRLAYAIPPDNPFAGRSDARPEIWAYGLRNPWRMSFDRRTGELWIGDVGQGSWEEIDRLGPSDGGANLGWSRMEGRHCYGGRDCDPAAYVGPITEYSHAEGCSVTGGHVYRGDRWPALAGTYLFADYCSGSVWGIASAAQEFAPPVSLLASGRNIVSFGEDEAGEIYIADISGGGIYRISGSAR
jgi:glucose/arabinose dehydrogenase